MSEANDTVHRCIVCERYRGDTIALPMPLLPDNAPFPPVRYLCFECWRTINVAAEHSFPTAKYHTSTSSAAPTRRP